MRTRLPILAAARQVVSCHKLLCAILLIGFAIRFSGLLWGFPLSATPSENQSRGYYNADEPAVFQQAVDFPGNYLSNTPYAYGSTIPYLVGMVCYPFKGLFVTRMNNPAAYELLVVVVFRLGSILAGCGSILLVYYLGKRFSGAAAGLCAALLLSVSFTHAMNSNYCNLDIWMGFLLLA